MSAISAGLLRVVPPGEYEAALRAQDEAKAAAEDAASATDMSDLAGFITTQFEIMRNHRNTNAAGWSNR